MSTPQQPELARSRRGATAPESAKGRASQGIPDPETAGPVPEDNLPGHHPEHDQDKPEVPPAKRRRTAVAGGRTAARATKKEAPPAPDATQATGGKQHFRFAFDPRMGVFALPFGVTPLTTGIDLDGRELRVRFGPWSVRTPVSNIESVEVGGPYSWLKVVGPARLSFADRGATFATNAERGVCLRFRQPVTALFPLGGIRHPGLTLTPENPDEFAEAIRQAIGTPATR